MTEHFSQSAFVAKPSSTRLPDEDGELRIAFAPGTRIQFELCRKRLQLGQTTVDQIWMPKQSLYPLRGQPAANYKPLLSYFWSRCTQHLTIMDEQVQQTYLLANLLPHVRSDAARRILRDSTLSKPSPKVIHQAAAELDPLLGRGAGNEMSRVEFHNQTANILGPPILEESLDEVYHTMASELLDPACRIMERQGEEAGIAEVRRCWDGWMKKFGRRRGKPLQKTVLDIISYEAKAALHRIYSCFWFDFINDLETSIRSSEPTRRFLRLWHLDPASPAMERDDARFHLFHGHIFGLHPASGPFIQTPTGQALIEAWLLKPHNEPVYRRLLNGLCIAMFHYASAHDEQQQRRRKQPISSDDLVRDEEITHEARTGKRRKGGR